MSKQRNITYGYKLQNGDIILDKTEANIICKIFDWYITGSSLNSIAHELNTRLIPYRQDQVCWNKHVVKRILDNKSYVGSVIDNNTFDKAQRIKNVNCTYKPKLADKVADVISTEKRYTYAQNTEVAILLAEIQRSLESTSIERKHIEQQILDCAECAYSYIETEETSC